MLDRPAINSTVQLDNHMQPQYLGGYTSTIHKVNGHTIVVYLDHPADRHLDGHINYAPEQLIPIQQE